MQVRRLLARHALRGRRKFHTPAGVRCAHLSPILVAVLLQPAITVAQSTTAPLSNGNAASSPSPTPASSASPMPSPAVTTSTATAPADIASSTAPRSKGAFEVPPEKAQPVTIPKFERPPVIDGKLEDDVWQNAAVLKDFYQIQPGDNTPPSRETKVLLGYDPKTLYIAFRVFDEPDKIRATVAKRDNIFNDDNVGFFLDTFNDQRKAFEMFFNPLGIQADGVMTESGGEDFSVDVLMESKGGLDDKGYIVEIAIPFKSLRYEAGKGKLWGAHFFRRIKRFENELDSWMPFSRSISSNLSQAGHLTGLEGIALERTVELIPSLTISENGRFVRSFSPPVAGTADAGRIVNEPVKLDAGLTAKFIPSSTFTLDLAINPDFAQVEADQIVVTANQRFPIFFPEKRPFFLEGIDIFRSPITVVHTRAIVDPDIAVKTTGKIGRSSFGIMAASDNGPGSFVGDERLNPNNLRFLDKNAHVAVLRLKRDIGKENSLGLIATSYSFIEKHNQLLSFDGRFRLDNQTTTSFQLIGTSSRNFFFDPAKDSTSYRTGNGFSYSADYNVSGRNWGWEVYGEGFTRDYRADVGFFQRTNSNFNFIFVRYNSDPNQKKKIISYHAHNATHIDYDWQGRMYTWETQSVVELALPRNSWFGVWWEPGYERLFDHEFGATREAHPCNQFAVSNKCTFYGPSNERSSAKNHLSVYGGSNYSKKIQFNSQITRRFGHFDLDFGNLPKYPRVSPAALLLGPDAPLDPGRGRLLQVNAEITYQPTNELRTSLNLVKERLVRYDTGRVAFDVNIWTFHSTYQFTKATFARAIVDFNTLNSRVRSQLLAGWTPSPGTSLYVGYNDDMNYNTLNPFTGQLTPGFRRNGRAFFIKMSYLIRKSFGR